MPDLIYWLVIGGATLAWRVLAHVFAFVAGVGATLFWQYESKADKTGAGHD